VQIDSRSSSPVRLRGRRERSDVVKEAQAKACNDGSILCIGKPDPTALKFKSL
jgi:hypothetical protein